MHNITGCSYDYLVRGVIFLFILQQFGGIHSRHNFMGAENCFAKRVFAPDQSSKQIMNMVIRHILDHIYLLQDDLALPLNFLFGKNRIGQQIYEKINH